MNRRTGPSAQTVSLVHQRDEDQCVVCGSMLALQIHYRRPRGTDGPRSLDANSPANLVTVCLLHRVYLERYREWALSNGLLVFPAQDPADVPLRTWRGWKLLDAAGGETSTERRP